MRAQATNCLQARFIGPIERVYEVLARTRLPVKRRVRLVSQNKRQTLAPSSEFGHCEHSEKDL